MLQAAPEEEILEVCARLAVAKEISMDVDKIR